MPKRQSHVFRTFRSGLSRRDFLKHLAVTLGVGTLVGQGLAVRARQPQPDTYLDANIDWGQVIGSSIVVSGFQHPWMTAISPLVPLFAELTGVRVDVQIVPESEYYSSLPGQLESRNPDPDVYMITNLGQSIVSGWLEPLDDFYANAERTDLNWYNPDDIFSSAWNFPVWNPDGLTYGVPITAEAQTLYLRRDLLDSAGLSAPTTFDELYDLAVALKTDDTAGIVMRGRDNVASVPWTAAGFIFSYGGEIADETGRIVFDSPQAIAAIDMYARLLRDAGPENAYTYDWFNALDDFMRARAASFCDSSTFMIDVQSDRSDVADVAQTAAFPIANTGQPAKPSLWHWNIGINPASQNKTAAWLFMQWATSIPTAATLAEAGVAAPRASAWAGELVAERFGADTVAGIVANLQAADSSPMKRAWFHPQSGIVLERLATAVNETISGAREVQNSLEYWAALTNDALGF